jgi:hypothetical protein
MAQLLSFANFVKGSFVSGSPSTGFNEARVSGGYSKLSSSSLSFDLVATWLPTVWVNQSANFPSRA